MARVVGNGQCLVCRHPAVMEINWLAAQGAPLRPLAAKFGLRKDSVYRHVRNHVSAEYKRAVKIGPFSSEAELRKLCAEAGTSVLDNLRGIYGGLAHRWLVAFAAGADGTLGALSHRMMVNLELQARLTRELLPPASTVVNNIFALPDFALLQAALLRVTATYPEARAAIVHELKALAERSPPLIEVAA